MSPLRVAAAQMQSSDNIDVNLNQMYRLLGMLSSKVRVVCFPENCLYLRIGESSKIPQFDLSEDLFRDLEKEAAKRNLGILLGSIPYSEQGCLTNAMVFIEPKCKSRVIYRKIHLFDVDVDGESRQRESDVFTPGVSPETFEFGGVKWGLSICYDLRFAELYLQYAKQGCEIFLVPSAFLPTTGAAHWEPLLRARAIEGQAYVIAPAQAGIHKNDLGHTRVTYGHSLIVNPWGQVLAEAKGDQPQTLEFDLDFDLLTKVRSSIPQSKHRKLKFS